MFRWRRGRAQTIDDAAAEAAAAKRAQEREWARERNRNFSLLLSSTFYVLAAIASIVIGVSVLAETVDDFKENTFYKFGTFSADQRLVVNEEPPPCGLATPDALALLQSLNRVGGGDLPGALLRPNYDEWIGYLHHSICSTVLGGVGAPPLEDPASGTCSATDALGYNKPLSEELLAIRYLIKRVLLLPNADENQLSRDAKVLEFEHLMCKNNSVYPEREEKVFGEFKIRITRAYHAAMPAFLTYHSNREQCGITTAEGVNSDPFSDCAHACHVLAGLEAAGQEASLMLAAHDAADGTESTLAEKLYRLIALSIAGYHDRRYNGGACFGNLKILQRLDTPTRTTPGTAEQLCDFVYNDVATTLPTLRGTVVGAQTPIEAYVARTKSVWADEGCTSGNDARADWTPHKWVWHATASVPHVASMLEQHKAVCAHMLRYGLYDTHRLFGYADPIRNFIEDKRTPDRFPWSLLGKLLNENLFRNIISDDQEDQESIFLEPIVRLEMYIAYRLAATAIWGTLVASCVGFFGFRAVLPGALILLKGAGFAKGADGVARTLTRPSKVYLPEKIAIAATLLVAAWVLFVDPAVQSAYYVTPTCTEWAGADAELYSSAYVASWGKKRFDRNGEQDLGVLLVFFVVCFFFHRFILRKFSPAAEAVDQKATDVAAGVAAPDPKDKAKPPEYVTSAFWATLFCGLLVVVLYGIQAGQMGRRFLKAAKNGEDTTAFSDDLSKDCFAAVWAGFFWGAAIGSIRQKWCISDLTFGWKAMWAGGSLLLIWMPVIIGSSLLSDELEAAFDEGRNADEETTRLVIFLAILIASVFATVAFALFANKYLKDRAVAGGTTTYAAVKRAKERIMKRRAAAYAPLAMSAAGGQPELRSVVCAPLLPHLPLKR